jgi:hypothetical protein
LPSFPIIHRSKTEEVSRLKPDLDFAESTKYIKLDLFPATVYTGSIGGEDNVPVFKEVRVIITNDYIYFVAMGPEGVYFALKEELVQYDLHSSGVSLATGINGTYVIERDGNCGCGTRLRGMRLLPGVAHTARIITLQ